MAHHYICTRCGERGYDFDQHTCKGKRPLNDLRVDLLYQLATDALTEREAWQLHDATPISRLRGLERLRRELTEMQRLGIVSKNALDSILDGSVIDDDFWQALDSLNVTDMAVYVEEVCRAR